MSFLTIKKLTKRFGGVTAVDDVSFSATEGKVLALIGPNGAGKTTCFNMIAGAFSPTEGTVHFMGQDVTGLKPHQLNKLGIARTFQIVKPLANLSVFENIMVACLSKSKNVKEAQRKAESIVLRTKMTNLRDTPASSLSIGNLKRLEVARALATEPKLLLMDEPMGGLTPAEVDEAIELIKTINSEGVSVIIIEHIMKAVMAVSDSIVVLQNGVKIAEGEPSAVVKNENVIKAYLGDGYASN
jgi:branched-chain amino acid transport system ATP-binding protein